MTLILAAANSDYVIQVTDRRLTSAGSVIDEEYEKCFSLALPGFRFSVAFTGLAKVGTHSTKIWLMDKLYDLAESAKEPSPILNALAAELTQLFNNSTPFKQLKPIHKTLVISCIGYNITHTPPICIAVEISNKEDPNGMFVVHFTALNDDAPADWTWLGAFGSGGEAVVGFETRLRKRLQARTPPEGMQAMMEKMVRTAASNSTSGGMVGMQLDSIRLYSDPTQPTQGGGSTMVNQPYIRIPSALIIEPDGSRLALTNFTVEDVSDQPPPMAVPKVRRNAPCPCGNGKRYGDCHGETMPLWPTSTLR